MSTELTPAQYLTTPYTPVAVYYHDSDMVEYLRLDVPSVYSRIDDFLALAHDMGTRELIGFRLMGFRNFYLNHLEDLQKRIGTDFLALVSVVEEQVKSIGDELFDERRREAYSRVREIAFDDGVRLADLPPAA